jgi:hypothetical protein
MERASPEEEAQAFSWEQILLGLSSLEIVRYRAGADEPKKCQSDAYHKDSLLWTIRSKYGIGYY